MFYNTFLRAIFVRPIKHSQNPPYQALLGIALQTHWLTHLSGANMLLAGAWCETLSEIKI